VPGTDADGRTGTQAAGGILVGQRMFGGLEDVLDGNQAAQVEFIVDDQHALQAMLGISSLASSTLALR
jgi:hypothetical protein